MRVFGSERDDNALRHSRVAVMSGSRVYSYYMLDVYDEKLRSIAEDEEKLKELSQRKVQKANSEMV